MAYSSYKFADYYHLSTQSTYPQYLYGSRFQAGILLNDYKGCFKAEYQNYHLNGKYSIYPNLTDKVTLNVPNEQLLLAYRYSKAMLTLNPQLSLGTNMGLGLDITLQRHNVKYFVQLSSQDNSAELNYNIKGNEGTNPFAWNESKIAIGTNSAKLDASLQTTYVAPLLCDPQFQNSIYSRAVKADFTYRLQDNWQAFITSNLSDTDVDLLYNYAHYGDIQNLRALTINSHLQKAIPHFQYRLALDAYFAGIGSETYLDIWPFTFFDTFLSHRTRIKKLGIQALSPGFEAIYISSATPKKGLSWQSGIAYHHLFHREDVIIRNRKAVFYPFLFTYDTNTYNWQDEVNGYFRLPLHIGFKHKKGSLELSMQQLVPVRWSKLFDKTESSTEPTSEVKQTQWGGFSCGVNAAYQF